MKLLRLTLAGALFVLISQHPVSAGPYQDDLSKCLVRFTNRSDRVALMRWLVVAYLQNPKVGRIATVDPGDGEALTKDVAKIFQRLLVRNCADETRNSVAYEGGGSIEKAFQTLGMVAGRELAGSPEVQKFMARLENYVDHAEIERKFK